jgi:hypothetical protein
MLQSDIVDLQVVDHADVDDFDAYSGYLLADEGAV